MSIFEDSDDDKGIVPIFEEYQGICSNLVQKMLTQNVEKRSITESSIFVPLNVFDNFVLAIRKGNVNFDETLREWNYDLQIDDTIYPTKLVWCYLPKRLALDEKITKSFSFLEPNYLSYVDKPFFNPDVITQVNLVLDYHRTQKRRRGIDIFNIFDLIAFKMAIDDNRCDYENCEFHKIIDRTLGEIIKSGRYKTGTKFDLDEYMHTVGRYPVKQFIDYLVYHFQKTINSIYWSDRKDRPNKLSSITNVPAFLDHIKQRYYRVVINETDSDGKCAEVLHDIITQSNRPLSIEFVLDGEWTYSGYADLLMEKSQREHNCEIKIRTKNSFHFIENFINWMKLCFGNELQTIRLSIENFENINPQIFNNCCLNSLRIEGVKLDYILINKFKKLKRIAGAKIKFFECRIANDINERFEFIRQKSANSQNIFKLLDELDNVKFIGLVLEEHTIGTILAYVESVMKEKNLETFKFKNKTRLTYGDFKLYLSFQRTYVNTDFSEIEMFAADYQGKVHDFYEFLIRRGLDQFNRDDFDFYQ